MDELRRRLSDLVDGAENPVSFNDVWRNVDMPRNQQKAKRRSGLWWAASGVAAVALVAAVFLSAPPAGENHHHGTNPPPSTKGANPQGKTGTTVPSSEAIIAQPSFSSVSMTSAETGWAEVLNGSTLGVAHTSDGGATWHDVTPRGVGNTMAFQPTGPESALLAWIRPLQAATVYTTSDGGKTWTHGKSFPIKYGDGNAYLGESGRDVWIEVGEAGMASVLPAQLFKSVDAGMTFALVNQSSSTSAHSSFPGFGPIVFLNAWDGFTSVVHGGPDGLGLYRTTDGGKTWSAATLPAGAQQVGLPVFSGQRGLAWDVQAVSSTTSAPSLLRTTDGGSTWQQAQIPLGSDSVAANPDVLSGTAAVMVGTSGTIYATTDGGGTWSTTKPGITAQQLLSTNVITQVSFFTPVVGWALIGPKGSALEQAALYLTTDGGVSWRAIAK